MMQAEVQRCRWTEDDFRHQEMRYPPIDLIDLDFANAHIIICLNYQPFDPLILLLVAILAAR